MTPFKMNTRINGVLPTKEYNKTRQWKLPEFPNSLDTN